MLQLEIKGDINFEKSFEENPRMIFELPTDESIDEAKSSDKDDHKGRKSSLWLQRHPSQEFVAEGGKKGK